MNPKPMQAATFRDFMSGFPSGVAVVTSQLHGRPFGFTCSSLCSVSMAPPVLLVCADTNGRSGGRIIANGRFAVNLLHGESHTTARAFATPGINRFDAVSWQSTTTGIPVLVDDAFAVAECRVIDHKTVGDHVIIFGRPVEISNFGDPATRPPLLYGMRNFSVWDEGARLHG